MGTSTFRPRVRAMSMFEVVSRETNPTVTECQCVGPSSQFVGGASRVRCREDRTGAKVSESTSGVLGVVVHLRLTQNESLFLATRGVDPTLGHLQ